MILVGGSGLPAPARLLTIGAAVLVKLEDRTDCGFSPVGDWVLGAEGPTRSFTCSDSPLYLAFELAQSVNLVVHCTFSHYSVVTSTFEVWA